MFDFTDKQIHSEDRAYLFGVERARDGYRKAPHELLRGMIANTLGQAPVPHVPGSGGWCEIDSYKQGIEDAAIWGDMPLADILATVEATR